VADTYGIKPFEDIVEHLWKYKGFIDDEGDIVFQYPDYGDLPRKMLHKLSNDAQMQIEHALGFYEKDI